MPIYEYKCKECGESVELIQSVNDAPVTKCEKCGGEMSKVLSPPAIQFKGSGWYVTDYSDKYSKKGKTEENSDKKEDKKTEEKKANTTAAKEN